MSDAEKWDRIFGVLGGRIFTLGALLVAVAVATMLVFLAPQFFDMPGNFAAVHHGDVDAFIRAGDLALAGEAASAYDKAIFSAPFSDANRGLLWFYPPHAFFAAMPLGAAPFIVVRPLWIALSVIAMVAAVRLGGVRGCLAPLIVVLSPAMFASLYFLQVGAFVAVGLAAALLFAPTRPIAAGILLGLMTMKPQYGLLVPVFLAATGQWRTFAAAAATCVVLVTLSFFFFGSSTWSEYIASISRDQASFFALAQPATASIGQLALKLGGPHALAVAAQISAIIAAGFAVFLAAKRVSYRLAAGLTVVLSLAAAPSSWTYDWPILVAGLAVVASEKSAWPWPLQALALAAWVAPFAYFLAAPGAVAAPFALAALGAALTAFVVRSPTKEHAPLER